MKFLHFMEVNVRNDHSNVTVCRKYDKTSDKTSVSAALTI